MRWLTIIGLVLSFTGGVVLAWNLFVSKDKAVVLAAFGFLRYDNNENLKSPAVQNLLRQSRFAKWGVFLLTIGFLFQLLGALFNI